MTLTLKSLILVSLVALWGCDKEKEATCDEDPEGEGCDAGDEEGATDGVQGGEQPEGDEGGDGGDEGGGDVIDVDGGTDEAVTEPVSDDDVTTGSLSITSPAANAEVNTFDLEGTCFDGFTVTVSGPFVGSPMTVGCVGNVFAASLSLTAPFGDKTVDVAQSVGVDSYSASRVFKHRYCAGARLTQTLGDGGNGDGTAMHPYGICNATQLGEVASFSDKDFELHADIDLGVSPWSDGEGWTPLPSFTGRFNGQGHKIQNLTMIPGDAVSGAGLFSDITGVGTTVQNLVIENPVIITDADQVIGTGALAVNIIYGASVSNIQVTGADISCATICGGVAGNLQDASVSGLTAFGSIEGAPGGYYMGGIFGNIYNSDVTVAQYLSSYVDFTGTAYIVGGIAGSVGGSQFGGKILDAMAFGNITSGDGANAFVGGIVGAGSMFEIERAASKGNLVGNGQYVGGIIGNAYDLTVINSAVYGTVNGGEDVGGMAGFSAGNAQLYQKNLIANSVTGTTDVGAFFGHFEDTGTFTANYWNGTINNTLPEVAEDTNNGGSTGDFIMGFVDPKTTVQMQNQATYTGWDFTTVWQINANEYPQLR